MKAKDILMTIMISVGKTHKEASEILGVSMKELNQELRRGTLSVDKFLRLIEELGVETKFVLKATGEEISLPEIKEIKRYSKGRGERVRGMSNRISFDTDKADALANTFYKDGKNEYSDGVAEELYVDNDGNYFIVEYFEDSGKRSKVNAITPNVANAFIEMYGELDNSE